MNRAEVMRAGLLEAGIDYMQVIEDACGMPTAVQPCAPGRTYTVVETLTLWRAWDIALGGQRCCVECFVHNQLRRAAESVPHKAVDTHRLPDYPHCHGSAHGCTCPCEQLDKSTN